MVPRIRAGLAVSKRLSPKLNPTRAVIIIIVVVVPAGSVLLTIMCLFYSLAQNHLFMPLCNWTGRRPPRRPASHIIPPNMGSPYRMHINSNDSSPFVSATSWFASLSHPYPWWWSFYCWASCLLGDEVECHWGISGQFSCTKKKSMELFEEKSSGPPPTHYRKLVLYLKCWLVVYFPVISIVVHHREDGRTRRL